MKVAILNRALDAFPGGAPLAIRELIGGLEKLDVFAVYLQGDSKPTTLLDYDLVHIMHVNFGWSRYNFFNAWLSDRPYVVTPIFYPDLSLGMDATAIHKALAEARCVMPFSVRERDELRTLT